MLNMHVVLLALINCVYAASQIALFTDSNCQDSYKGLEGPNGYPNGSCTDIRRSGDYGSLQVVGLDPGCAGTYQPNTTHIPYQPTNIGPVTIYVNDSNTTICGGYQEEIQIGECWNSTFVYYSIDMCDLGALTSPSVTASASASSGPTTGTLVGGIVGGLAGLAVILGIALWVLARKKRARKQAAAEGQTGMLAEVESNPYRGEMEATYHRHEMEERSVVYKHQAAEVAQPPVELGGHELERHDAGGHEARRGAP
jgi:hypothetical protein